MSEQKHGFVNESQIPVKHVVSLWQAWTLASVLLVNLSAFGADEPPKSLDPRLKIELFAEHPQIVTPTGMDVDHQGRVFAIESNTHFPPEGYAGHPTDRVLVMTDTDGDGRADRIVVFTDKLVHSMSVAVRPLWFPAPTIEGKPAPAQSIYVATRRDIYQFHDDDGDDVSDRTELLVHVETEGNYPHNALAGFAIDGLGWMYFGFGENMAFPYKMIGSDGTIISGTEGGNIYRCRLDGTHLSRVCTGFWNPHANAFDAFGRLFSVDNDPDSRPPCRLIHVIPDGDYGYRFSNGRKGLHPFTSWNGEVPGTLPMVAGTGEAPSGIVAYESDGLPEEYIGNLLVTSWGDHRIDRFRLQPKGTSFTSLAEPVITGGENFRPVGLAAAPDGSLYCTDWVLRDYKLHLNGRVWRISPTTKRTKPVIDLPSISGLKPDEQAALLDSPRREVRRMAAHQLTDAKPVSTRGKLELFWSLKARELAATNKFELDGLADYREAVPNLAEGKKDEPPFTVGTRKAVGPIQELIADALSDARLRQPDRDLLLPMLSGEKLVPDGDLVKLIFSLEDPFAQSLAVTLLSRQFKQDQLVAYLNPGSNASVASRIGMVLAARKQNPKEDRVLRVALADRDADVRRVAVQWAAEEKLLDLRPRVEAMLSSPGMTVELFLATLAALHTLDGGKPADFDKLPPETYVIPLLKDESRSEAVRAQALRLIPPTDKVFDTDLLTKLCNEKDNTLRMESIRTLQAANPAVSAGLLSAIAGDEKRDVIERAEAVVGLSTVVKTESPGGPGRTLLIKLLTTKGTSLILEREAVRAARGLLADDPAMKSAVETLAQSLEQRSYEGQIVELADQIALALTESKLETPASIRSLLSRRPKTNGDWMAQLNRGREVDPQAGRRTFYHPSAAGCAKCHRINGRGGRIGPDLSRAVGTMNRVQLIQSILEPSREISPQYVTWLFTLRDGRTVTGMIVQENEGKTIVGNAEGQTVELKTADIEERTPLKTSVMPEKLTDRLTLQELRDLIAFLDAQR